MKSIIRCYREEAIEPVIKKLQDELTKITNDARNNKKELQSLIEEQTSLKRQKVVLTDLINGLKKHRDYVKFEN
jgi:vacuolar-type H+-ATPase subunit E/Vma4